MDTRIDLVDVAVGVLVERYRQTVDEAAEMLRSMAAGDGEDVGDQALRVIEAARHAPDGEHGPPEPASVRRAAAFIERNAQLDVQLIDVVEVAGIGARALQTAFRKHRRQTLTGYLRAVRIAGAHRDLVAGDSANGDTVAAIVTRWRFSNPGRFSVEYREIYGQSPSHTLRG